MSDQVETDRKSFTDEKHDPEGKIVIDDVLIAVSLPSRELGRVHLLIHRIPGIGGRRCFLR